MRKFAEKCNATSSTTLRGTALRKHVATYCIQLNLNEVEVSELATFMGHADKIHKQHYRQPQASRDILKISKYLEAVQGDVQNSNDEYSSDMKWKNVLKKNFCLKTLSCPVAIQIFFCPNESFFDVFFEQ